MRALRPILLPLLFLFLLPTLAAAETASDSPLRVGGSVTRPELISSVPIECSEEANKAKITGAVIVETVIDEGGNVEIARALKGMMGLGPAAEKAVRQWKFKPATLDGKPVKVYFTVTVMVQCPK